jgi:integrase
MLADGLDPSTIRNTLMPLRAIYRRALARGEVAVSPLVSLELPAVRGRRERVVPPEEARLLVAGAPKEERALWATALYGGLRRGELMALRWEDVDLGAGRLSVRASWDIREGRVPPKSRAGVRDVPITEPLRVHLADHRLRTRADGLVFGRNAERPFEPVGVAARADEAWAAHGLERVTLHECRHAYSTFLDAAGVWPTRADRYMGHADHSTPGRYRHQLEGQLADDAALLDAYLSLTGAHDGAQLEEVASLSES